MDQLNQVARDALLGALLLALGPGCGGCEDSAVPFKRGSFEAAKDAGAPAALEPPAEAVRLGVSYPPSTHRAELDGASVELAGASLRAGLEVDLDGDGKLDALLVVEDASRAPRLALARRTEQGFSTPTITTDLRLGAESCALETAALEALGQAYAVVRAELRCGAATATPAPTPTPAPAPAPEGRALRGLWIVTLGTPPSVLESIQLPAADDASGPRLTAGLRAADLDGDGHADLVLGLSVAPLDLQPIDVAVTLWNRAGGLARDAAEPERTLLALADQAKAARRSKPDAASALARRVAVAHEALCREGREPKIALSGALGLSCGPSLAAGRAGSVLVALLAQRGELLEALERYELLRSPGAKLTDNDWERAKSALDARIERGSFTWIEGPRVDVPAVPRARLSALAFVDEGHVLIRGPLPRSFALDTKQADPIGVMGSMLLSDPSARFAIAGLTRDCEGVHARIVHLAQIVEGVVSGPTLSEPLLAARPPPPGAQCHSLTPSQRDDMAGVEVLAWTTQGVLFAQRGALWLLPVDAKGSATSDGPHELSVATAPPKTTYASQWTPDGRVLAVKTALGIALHDRVKRSTRLIAPPGDASLISDVAVSASGNALAIVHGGRLLVGVQGGGQLQAPMPMATPTTAPTTTTTTAPAPATTPPPPPTPPPAPPAANLPPPDPPAP